MTEHDIQARICMELSRRGYIVLRLNNGLFYTRDGRPVRPGYPNGTSDLLALGDGVAAFIEVKTPTGRVSPEQTKFIEHMRALHHPAGIARSVEDAIKIIMEGNENV